MRSRQPSAPITTSDDIPSALGVSRRHHQRHFLCRNWKCLAALLMLITWVGVSTLAVVRGLPPNTQSRRGRPTSLRKPYHPAGGKSAPPVAFSCSGSYVEHIARTVRTKATLRVDVPVTSEVDAACMLASPSSLSSPVNFVSTALQVLWNSGHTDENHTVLSAPLKKCASAVQTALADLGKLAQPQLPLEHDEGRISFDYVVSFVNGSAPGFRERWCSAMRSNRSSDTLDTIDAHLGMLKRQSSDAETLRLQKIREQLAVSRCVHEFPEERFRDWGEVNVALRSVARCSNGGARSTEEPPLLSPSRLPLSGRVVMVVSHPDQIPHILQPSRDGCAWTPSSASDAIRPRCFSFENLRIRVVYHDELLISHDNNHPATARDDGGREMFSANAIETLLHRIPSTTSTGRLIGPWFVYGNNDMIFGRCPTWADYFQVVDVTTVVGSPHPARRLLRIGLYPKVWAEGYAHAPVAHLMEARVAASRRAAAASTAVHELPEAVVIRAQEAHLGKLLQPHFTLMDRNGSVPSSPPPDVASHQMLARIGFAHYPRMFSAPLLSWLMDESPLRDEAKATRVNGPLQRRDSQDIWVPYLADHVLLFAMNVLVVGASNPSVGAVNSLCSYCNAPVTEGRDAQASSSCVGLVNVKHGRAFNRNEEAPMLPRSNFPPSNRNIVDHDYYFFMMDSFDSIVRAKQELFPPTSSSNDQTNRMLPLFITLNDNMPRSNAMRVGTSDKGGSNFRNPQRAVDQLLRAIAEAL